MDFAKRMEEIGVQTLICTDISKDGTLQGPNFKMLEALKNHVSCNLIASGGVRDLSHIKKCKDRLFDIYNADGVLVNEGSTYY